MACICAYGISVFGSPMVTLHIYIHCTIAAMSSHACKSDTAKIKNDTLDDKAQAAPVRTHQHHNSPFEFAAGRVTGPPLGLLPWRTGAKRHSHNTPAGQLQLQRYTGRKAGRLGRRCCLRHQEARHVRPQSHGREPLPPALTLDIQPVWYGHACVRCTCCRSCRMYRCGGRRLFMEDALRGISVVLCRAGARQLCAAAPLQAHVMHVGLPSAGSPSRPTDSYHWWQRWVLFSRTYLGPYRYSMYISRSHFSLFWLPPECLQRSCLGAAFRLAHAAMALGVCVGVHMRLRIGHAGCSRGPMGSAGRTVGSRIVGDIAGPLVRLSSPQQRPAAMHMGLGRGVLGGVRVPHRARRCRCGLGCCRGIWQCLACVSVWQIVLAWRAMGEAGCVLEEFLCAIWVGVLLGWLVCRHFCRHVRCSVSECSCGFVCGVGVSPLACMVTFSRGGARLIATFKSEQAWRTCGTYRVRGKTLSERSDNRWSELHDYPPHTYGALVLRQL